MRRTNEDFFLLRFILVWSNNHLFRLGFLFSVSTFFTTSKNKEGEIRLLFVLKSPKYPASHIPLKFKMKF